MKAEKADLTMFEILDAAKKVEKETGQRLTWVSKGDSHDFADQEAWEANEALAKAISKQKAG